MRKSVSIFVPLVFGAALLVAYSQNAQSQRGTSRELPQPAGWVEFEADIVKTAPQLPPIPGLFRRNNDGSTRTDSFLPEAFPEKVAVIGIVNHTKGIVYTFRTDTGVWSARALGMTPKAASPPRFLANTKGLSKAAEKREGLELYQYVQPIGDVRLLAPALNFFEVMSQQAARGMRRELSNIRIRPQADDLFMPPPNAVLKMDGPSVEDLLRERRAKQKPPQH